MILIIFMNILKKYKTFSKDDYNLVLLTEPFGKFKVPESKDDMDKIHKYILQNWEKDIDYGLCECQEDDIYEPLYYDLDFSLLEPIDIEANIINRIISIINTQIIYFLKIVDNDCLAFVLKKENPIEERKNEDYWHVGVHIYYPYIRLKAEGRQILYHHIIKELSDDNFLLELPLLETKLEEILDHRVIKKNAIIKYGCNKKDKKRYELEYILDSKLNIVKKDYSKLELIDLLSIRGNNWYDTKIITEFKDKINIEQLLKEIYIEHIPIEHLQNTIKKKRNERLDTKLINRVKKLVSFLSIERATNYESWINVGLCLHNISDSNEFLEIWKAWSLLCSNKANKTNFKKLWNNFKQRANGLKIGTLTVWAKEDNLKEFLLYKIEEIQKGIRESFDKGQSKCSYNIALVLKNMYEGIYVCSNIKANTWYEFREHSYYEIQAAYTLFINISEELVHQFESEKLNIEEEAMDLKKKIHNNEDISGMQEKLKTLEINVKSIDKIIESLKDSTFKEKIMKEAKSLFHDENFEINLNETKHLIVFDNGVYDLNKNEFRDGRPEDFMSFRTKINYLEYDDNDVDIQKVYHIFSQIHPDDETRHFFFSTIASGLHGISRDQKFDIWIGNGANGKSVTSDFLSQSLGDYFESPQITMLTRKRGASANASPDLYKLKGKRIICYQEPEFDDELHSSMLKQMSGNDWIEARALFGNPIKFKPQASGFLACNALPKIASTDGGTWRRIRVLEFKSKFISNPKKPNEFKKDPKLIDDIPLYCEAFMSIILHYWKKLSKADFIIKEPKCVKEYTKRYQADSNIYLSFKLDKIEEISDTSNKLSLTSIWELFKPWYKQYNPSTKPPPKNQFEREMISLLGDINNENGKKGWLGFKIKELVEDIENYSEL